MLTLQGYREDSNPLCQDPHTVMLSIITVIICGPPGAGSQRVLGARTDFHFRAWEVGASLNVLEQSGRGFGTQSMMWAAEVTRSGQVGDGRP